MRVLESLWHLIRGVMTRNNTSLSGWGYLVEWEDLDLAHFWCFVVSRSFWSGEKRSLFDDGMLDANNCRIMMWFELMGWKLYEYILGFGKLRIEFRRYGMYELHWEFVC